MCVTINLSAYLPQNLSSTDTMSSIIFGKQIPTTQLAKMSIDLKFVELTADVLEIFFMKYLVTGMVGVPDRAVSSLLLTSRSRFHRVHAYTRARVGTFLD